MGFQLGMSNQILLRHAREIIGTTVDVSLSKSCNIALKPASKFKPPNITGISRIQWESIGGPRLLRLVSDKYEFTSLSTIFAKELSAKVTIKMDGDVVPVGKLLPALNLEKKFQFKIETNRPLVSAALVDFDCPEVSKSLIFAAANITVSSDFINMESCQFLLSSLPIYAPEISRGGSEHRISLLVWEHEAPLSDDEMFIFGHVSNDPRKIEEISSRLIRAHFNGFSFFRTCWVAQTPATEIVEAELRDMFPK